MKKIILICTTFFVAGLFTACDPGYSIDYSICNKSGHNVTIKSTDPSDLTLWRNNPDGITMRNGADTLFLTTNGLGCAEIGQAEHDIRTRIYGDTVTFTFDDGKKLVLLRKNGEGVFDIEGNHYSWTSYKEYFSYYGQLAYTITEEDYNNAQ